MQFGAFWKNREGEGLSGRVDFDAQVTLLPGVKYDLFLNPNDKQGNEKAPDFRLELRLRQ